MKPSIIQPLTVEQQAVVDLLEETLETARTGVADAIGVVLCMKDGYASAMVGKRASDLNLGCDSLKRKILDAVENRGSQILRGRA